MSHLTNVLTFSKNSFHIFQLELYAELVQLNFLMILLFVKKSFAQLHSGNYRHRCRFQSCFYVCESKVTLVFSIYTSVTVIRIWPCNITEGPFKITGYLWLKESHVWL